ncbi:MAG: ABC transporter substrate-binding protein, partial [Chloroflexota bacterium]
VVPVGTAFPVTITDDAGRQVRIERQPQRIVSAAPSNTEILYALGVDSRVVAVTDFCDYPPEAKLKPKIGGFRPSLETIVAQQPDLVLAVRGFPADALAALEGQQIPVVILNPPDFAGVLANIRTVGRMTGAMAAAERVTGEMQRRWNAVAEKGKAAPSKPRVFFEIDATDPAAVSAAGPGTFIDAMITAAGGVNVLATLTPGQQYPKISAEALLQANPQLIILGDAPFGQSAEVVARRPGWAAIEAVQNGAIVEMTDSNIVSRPGPRLVDGLEVVAKAIHPELFGSLPASTGAARP